MLTTSKQSPQLANAYAAWERLQQRKVVPRYELDGNSLHIADVVSVALHECKPEISSNPKVLQSLQDSVNVLMDHLSKGYYVYGVNTGFGGSADSRTEEVVKLQSALMQLTQAGILTQSTEGKLSQYAMPAAWVRATIAVRLNATVRGHSAVSLPICQALVDLLKHGLTPVVPLRGSVSASGDLMPLSYIAGAIEGNPDILIETSTGQILPAPEALALVGMPAVKLGPKEGLGLVNGTASSAALGALVMNHANNLAVLTQALTAIAVEALNGSKESFDPFIAQVRPHSGQIESARNIAAFLQESRLARDIHDPADRRKEDLIQDRYALRSAPQWIGPQLEDLLLADMQITTELNSSCDNPLVNAMEDRIMYGCNFQAASVTSAMEKTRLSLQMFGRILFSQLTEMVDPTLSGGLPASLAADDPSLSFTMKGVEISMASYMAELSYLANPMSSHVQAAEMHNQSVNSMAFASGRMTMQAIEILTMMSACHLYAGCQALDIRALYIAFKERINQALMAITQKCFGAYLFPEELESLQQALTTTVGSSWKSTGKQDLRDRCNLLADATLPVVLERVNATTVEVLEWKNTTAETAFEVWNVTFAEFCKDQNTYKFLGNGSKVLYQFVRQQLGVPFHQGFVEHPTIDSTTLDGREKKSVGGWISVIHEALLDGSMYGPLLTLAAENLLSERREPAARL